MVKKRSEDNLHRSKNLNPTNEEKSILLIIDMQKKLLAPIANNKIITANIVTLLEAAKILRVNTLHTEQNPSKLGETIEPIKCNIFTEAFKKKSFSCSDLQTLNTLINDERVNRIYLCGIETHICILQTALAFDEKGIEIHLIIDAIASRYQFDNDIAVRRMENQGIILSTTESTIFQWCKTSDRSEFRDISNLIKKRARDLANLK